MKQTKRILSLLLVMTMLFSLFPLALTAAAREPSYEVVDELANLTEGQYVITLWRYIGQSNAEGMIFHSVNDNSLPAEKNEDYSLLTNEGLPLTAVWNIAPAEGGFTIQNAGNGLYLGDAVPAASEEPVVHKIVEGTCNGVHNYAIGNSAGTGSLRYSNSSKSFSFNTTAPETEVGRAYAANVILYRVVNPVPTNVAPKATASTATCASWNNVAGVNDGSVPAVSQGNQAGAYGSWGQNNACDPEIITLLWDAPVELEGAGVFFWHDNGKDNRTGIDFPLSYSFEYLEEDGETWSPVPDAEGMAVDEDVMNQTVFGAVITRGLRLVMIKEAADDNSYGLGVAEIEAYGWLTELVTAELEAAIARAEAITNLDNYTDESVAALTEALAAARAVLENPADQEAIDAAAAALNAAIDALAVKPVEKPAQENIAPQGTATAQYCASWNNVAGVNDGSVPAQSSGNQAGAYGSWGQNNNAAPEPITISFAEEVTLYGAGMYFWHDDGMNNRNGIDFPASYSFEYLDGEDWLPVQRARGMNNLPDEMNYSVFDHVTTTALRVLLQKSAAGSFGLGVAEFEIYGVFGAVQEPVQFFAGSDIQSSSSQGVSWDKYLSDIVRSASEAGHRIDVSFWCGDYADGSVYADGSDTSGTETPQRVQYIRDTLGAYWSDVEFYFAQGNHDGSQHIGTVLDETGPKEHEDFVLYQINEDDFPWWQAGYSSYSSEDTCLEKINATTETLAAYLDGLIAAEDQRVIFIYTHVPLHWSSRSTTMNSWWSDNIHADILFNMINEKAEDLDIVFLYGHNHSENYAEAYPAGGTVNFFAPGDTIRIPNGQVAASGNYTEEIIKFTYLNAGYVGATAAGFSPSVATASVITLNPESVEFTRYSAAGRYEGSDHTLIRNNRGEYPAYLQLSSVENYKLRNEGDTEHFLAVLKNAEAAEYSWSVEGCGEVAEGQGTNTAAIVYNGGGEAVIKVAVSYLDSSEQTQTLEQSMTVTVNAAPDPGQHPNIAPQAANVEAPYCASWNNLGGVNDGVLPSASNTAGDNTAYGSWRSNATADPEYITFSFAQPAQIFSAGAYFLYNENSPHEQYGIDFPDSYTYEYLNDAGQWVEVPSAEGYGLEENIVNPTAFEPITSTSFRIVMQRQAGSFGLGVGEIEIYGEFVTLDTAALEAAIAQAEALDESGYTPESWAALQEVLAEAKNTLENAVSQAGIDAAAEALLGAIAALEELTPDYVDKAALGRPSPQAEALDESLWTPESWAALQAVLADAKAVEADGEATQEQVDAATEALLAAIAALVDKVQAVIDLIDALPDPITLEDIEALTAAREAYDALTDEEKARVSNYLDLLLAEIEYYRLLAEQAFNDTVQAAIDTLREYFEHASQNHDEAHVAAAEAALEEAIAALLQAKSSEELRAIVDAGVAAIDEALKGGDLPAEHVCAIAQFVDLEAYPYGTPEHEAIEWAFTHDPQITAGTDASHFNPEAELDRKTAMTFLYAAAGKPAFDVNSAEKTFSDVAQGKWYTKAILWAANQNPPITSGNGDGSFGINTSCKRSHMLTFLYAQQGKPGFDESKVPKGYVEEGKWYTKAAKWAYACGIETGEDGVFQPNTVCTRATTVLYLYRALEGKALDE